MSRFVVNLNEVQQNPPAAASEDPNAPPFQSIVEPKKHSVFVRVLGALAMFLLVVLLVASVGGYFYWQSVKKTPAYSLALVVDAARRDDKAEMEQVVDTDAVVDNFMPQVMNKAVELYGRNLPPATIAKMQEVAAPALPLVKERAKAELPGVIREKTAAVEKVPYWLIALGADRAVDISVQNDTATVVSKISDRPLNLTMKRSSDGWKIVALKDDALAQNIAEKIGQEIIAVAAKGGIKKAGEQMGVKNLDEILKNAKDIFK